jgi:hypothetical protein
MSLGLRLSLLPLLIAGCASQLVTVPASDWQTVPAPQRETVDRQHAADLAAARTELTAATASLAAAQRSQPPPVAASRTATAPRTPVTAKPAAGGDDSAKALQAQEKARIDVAAQIESAKAAWQRADLTWRQRRVDAANARFAVLDCQRELVRAQTIEHNLPGTDTYDIAPLRGQFSQAQQRWYGAANKARQARAAFEQASANLSAAKEAYAQVMRGGPRPAPPPSLAAAPPPLELPGWTLPRSEVRRRRGLRRSLDAGTSPQLRGVAIQLKVTSRTSQAIALGMTPIAADSPTTNAKPVIEAPQVTVPPAPAKPAATPPPSAPAVAAKPAAAPPPPSAPTVAAKPAAAPPSAPPVVAKPAATAPSAPTVAAKPAAAPPPSAPVAAKPAAAPQSAPAVAKPADAPLVPTSAAAGPTANPKPATGAPASKPSAAAAKPAAAPPQGPPNAAAKPADAPLFPTSAAAGPAVSPRPAAAPQPGAPTAAAKPAERPVSQTDPPKH